jgi:eukaryotic-like serine/threonine-protein kinase
MSLNKGSRPDESAGLQALQARDLSLAETLEKYRLIGALGHGGMADVYLAVADGPEGFRKLCVLKLLKESMAEEEEFRAMFLDEARLAARLNHPNIVQTFEVGELHGRMMIAMEYIEGQPATRVIRRLAPAGKWPLTASVSILCDVLDALEYAHGLADFDGAKLGIVHRDVSPHNVIIGYDGRVKLVDFGIAKSSAAMQETQAGVLKGKAGYMAPEQASLRHLDGRADVFSVGVMLWEAIAGRRLSEGMTAPDILVRRIEGREPKIREVVPDADPALAAICDRAMERDPARRHASAAELQAELEGWLEKRPSINRRELASSLREAFAKEREQLRAMIEQQLAECVSSGMRQALLGATGSLSVRRLNTPGGDGLAAPLTPASGMPRAALDASGPTTASADIAQLVATRRSRRWVYLLGGAAALAVVVAAVTYATSARRPASEEGSAALPATTPVERLVEPESSPPRVPDDAPEAKTAPEATAEAKPAPGAEAPPEAKTAPRRPARPSVAPPATPLAPTATPATGLTPPPPKQPTRRLDEMDPYAP